MPDVGTLGHMVAGRCRDAASLHTRHGRLRALPMNRVTLALRTSDFAWLNSGVCAATVVDGSLGSSERTGDAEEWRHDCD